MYAVTAEWKHYTSQGRKAEGRIIYPSEQSGDLILYVPGFPGGGATLFERNYSDRLRNEDFNQIILRHNGTLITGPFGDEFLNRKQFPKAVPYHDGVEIGDGVSSIEEWLNEPRTVLEDAGSHYTNITIIAHSFGALAALHSLAGMAEDGDPLIERVHKCICLAPAVGILKEHDDDIMDTLWSEEFLSNPELAQKVLLNGADAIRSDLRNVYKNLPQRVAENLTSVTKIFVHVERDEYIRHADVEEFMLSSGLNCRFVLDRFDRHDPRTGYDAHDMPNYPQQTLLDLIEGQYDAVDTIRQSTGFIEE